MGLRGPQPTDTMVLARRGSWLAKDRLRNGKSAGISPAKPSSATKLHIKKFRMSEKRVEVICRAGINGYDPWATRERGQEFDPKVARNAIKYFATELVHVKGEKANHGFELEPWEVATIGNLFGWKNKDGTRRYRVCTIFVPRKNGKSPLAAGIIVFMLDADGEPGAEIYGAASTYRQASLVFAHARGMVERNPRLAAKFQIFKGQAKAIEDLSDHSVYAVVASEGLAAHGWNTHLGLIDELHAQPDGELKEALETSVAGRRQPLLMYLTTSDYDRPSVCNEEIDYAVKVRDGIIADSAYLPVLYFADRTDDWEDEAVWAKANPNLDVSVKREYLRQACEKAKKSPAKLNSFLRLHLNIRTSTDDLWLRVDQWDSMARPDFDCAGLRCYTGLDLSSTRDMTAFVQLFPLDDGYYFIKPRFWVPGGKVQSDDPNVSDRMDYAAWAKGGWVKVTEDEAIDYGRIRADVAGWDNEYDIADIAVDRLFQGEETVQKLMEMGFEGRVTAFGQGFMSMAAPTKRFDELFYEGKLLHDGNPVMRWMVSNAVVKYDEAGNMKPNKKKSTGKIDGVVAAIMALGRAMVSDGAVSRYNDDDWEPFSVEF